MLTITIPTESPDLDSSTEDYASRFAGPVGEYFLDVQWNIVESMLPRGRCRVLDVGGGHGQLAGRLSEAGYDVSILGSDDSCVPRLNRLFVPGSFEFITGDLLDLPFDNQTFDVVLAFRLLPHLRHWQRFVGEICRVADQRVILDYPDLRSVNWFGEKLFGLKKSIETNTRRYTCFHRNQIRTAVKQNGFDHCDLQGQFLAPMALHRLCRTPWLSKLIENPFRRIGITNILGSPIICKADRI